MATLGATVIVSNNHGLTWAPVGPTLPYAPNGLVYAPIRKAFYIWRFDCNTGGDTSVKADSIMRWDYTGAAS
jgi:hypothetical protein